MYRLWTSDKANGGSCVVAISCNVKNLTLHSCNIRLVNFLFALVCQLCLCLHKAQCVPQLDFELKKPRHQTNKYTAAIQLPYGAWQCLPIFPIYWLIQVIKWPSLVQILWSLRWKHFSHLLKLLLLMLMTIEWQILTLSNHHRLWRSLWPNHIYS